MEELLGLERIKVLSEKVKDKSLVTVEVRNNEVVQQRTKNNNDTTKEQKKFLKKWEKNILRKGEEKYV